jgi:hypothetical protein
MTKNQVSVAIGIIGFIAIGTAIAFWSKMQPPETPEQIRARSYYNCVATTYTKGRDIANCNQIK